MPTLVLLRHGQSEWNLANKFTGWIDVGLTEQGESEARAAGKLLKDEGYAPDVVFTSLQRRAIRTAELVLDVLGVIGTVPIERAWQLNERHYGGLQGLDKKAAVEECGEEQVKLWRRSYATPPPKMSREKWDEQRAEPAYASVSDEDLPWTECLADVVARMLPYWEGTIVPELRKGHRVFVVAHGNSLRALVMHLEALSEDDVVELNIPTGEPLVYDLDDEMLPVGLRGKNEIESRYLRDPEAIRAAAEAVARQTG